MKRINYFIFSLERAIGLIESQKYEHALSLIRYNGFYSHLKQFYIDDSLLKASGETYINSKLNDLFHSDEMGKEVSLFRELYFSQTYRYQYFVERSYYCAIASIKLGKIIQAFQYILDIYSWIDDGTVLGGKNVNSDLIKLIINANDEEFGDNFVSLELINDLEERIIHEYSIEKDISELTPGEIRSSLLQECINIRENYDSPGEDHSKPDWYTQENNTDWDDAPSR